MRHVHLGIEHRNVGRLRAPPFISPGCPQVSSGLRPLPLIPLLHVNRVGDAQAWKHAATAPISGHENW